MWPCEDDVQKFVTLEVARQTLKDNLCSTCLSEERGQVISFKESLAEKFRSCEVIVEPEIQPMEEALQMCHAAAEFWEMKRVALQILPTCRVVRCRVMGCVAIIQSSGWR